MRNSPNVVASPYFHGVRVFAAPNSGPTEALAMQGCDADMVFVTPSQLATLYREAQKTVGKALRAKDLR